MSISGRKRQDTAESVPCFLLRFGRVMQKLDFYGKM